MAGMMAEQKVEWKGDLMAGQSDDSRADRKAAWRVVPLADKMVAQKVVRMAN